MRNLDTVRPTDLSQSTRARITYWLKRAVLFWLCRMEDLGMWKLAVYFARLWNDIMKQNPPEGWKVYWQLLISSLSVLTMNPWNKALLFLSTHTLTFLTLLSRNHTFYSKCVSMFKNCLIRRVSRSWAGRRWGG